MCKQKEKNSFQLFYIRLEMTDGRQRWDGLDICVKWEKEKCIGIGSAEKAYVFPRNGRSEVSPQIPNYIRVKDDSVKVSNVKTYLVKKLGLASEAEVEITCMGQNLLPSQTLKEVRDTVWFPGLMQSLNVRGTPSAGTELLKNDSMYHILTMDYQRRGSSDLEE